MRKQVVSIMIAAVFTVGIAGTAVAGERTGQGKPTPISNPDGPQNSECAFSGLEDHDFESDVVPGEVQNWGAIPKAVRDAFPWQFHPGNSCNPNGAPLPG